MLFSVRNRHTVLQKVRELQLDELKEAKCQGESREQIASSMKHSVTVSDSLGGMSQQSKRDAVSLCDSLRWALYCGAIKLNPDDWDLEMYNIIERLPPS